MFNNGFNKQEKLVKRIMVVELEINKETNSNKEIFSLTKIF